jgi:uncharacterized protein YjbJ (UPF0337 family)
MRPSQFHLVVGTLLLAASPLAAQTAVPGSAAASGDGMGWIWIVLLLAVVGAAVWYFMFRNKSSVTSTSTSFGMDRDRVAGSAKQVTGAVKDGVGNVLGDTKLQAEGKLDKAEGRAQNTVGGVKDTLRGK